MADSTKTIKVVIEAEDRASETLKTFASRAEKLSGQMTKAGQAMIALGAAPTAALVGATKAAIDFEDSFAGVKKTVDLTEAEFDQLAQNFRNISKVTPLAINDLNRIGEIAGSLGVSGVDNITKFTETIAKIGITTNLTEEEAAMAFGRIANIMQEPIGNVDKMGSAVVDLGNKFAATERDITEFSERIAGAGKIAGLTTSDIFAIGTAMSSVGVEAEAGGTAVQKVLISMYQAAAGSTSEIIDNSKAIAKNTEKIGKLKTQLEHAQLRQKEFTDKTKGSTKAIAQSKIDKYAADISAAEQELSALNATNGQAAISIGGFAKVLGVTNSEFTKMFKQSPTAVFEAFVERLGQISKEGGDAAGVLEELDLADQRLIRSFLSLSNAGTLLHDTIRTGRASWEENAALQTEAEKRYATTTSQIQIAKNNLYDLGITIGSTLLPILNDFLKAMKPVIENVARFAEQHPTLTKVILIAGAALAVLGTALVAVAAILPGLVTIFTGLSTAIGFVAPIIGGLIAIIGGPFTLVLLGLFALSALLTTAWLNNWGNIQQKTKSVIDAISNVVKGLISFFETRVIPFIKENFAKGIMTAVDVLSGGWIGRFKGMIDIVNGLIGAIGSLISKAQELANKSKGGLKIPGFQHGGFVPGSFSTPVPAILHGGERVIPRNGVDVNPQMGGGSSNVSINISGSFNIDSPERVDELANKIIRILGRQNELAGKGLGI